MARETPHAQDKAEIAQEKAAQSGGGPTKADFDRRPDETPKATPSAHAKETAKAATGHLIRQHELVERVRAYDQHVDEDMLNRAYVFSMKAHGGQTRKSGDPYFVHPLAVASILTDIKADPATVATALLHDVVEDTDVSVAQIRKLFGEEIATLVDGVTKLSKIELRSEASKQAENFRKLVVAMAEDVRVLLVKLADRLHNMRTLHHVSDPEKRRKVALETMEIYAPLAGRIGVQRFRDDLEDLSFMELSPQAYETITTRLDELQRSIEGGVASFAIALRDRLAESGSRPKSTAAKSAPIRSGARCRRKASPSTSSRTFTPSELSSRPCADCYKALGAIHTTWRMIPTEFDDYISAQKPNNYRSIHTAVIGPPRSDGEPPARRNPDPHARDA